MRVAGHNEVYRVKPFKNGHEVALKTFAALVVEAGLGRCALMDQHDDRVAALCPKGRDRNVRRICLVAKLRPATAAGVTTEGVSFSVMPMKATRTRWLPLPKLLNA